MFKVAFKAILILLPWFLRRPLLVLFFKYELHPKSKIGLAWVYPQKLIMEEGSFIDHLTVAIHLDKLVIKQNSTIGRNNWITGFPSGTISEHFAHQPKRTSELILGRESAITKKHHIDCTNKVQIGDFVTIAGYNTQLLTHSINIVEGRQDSAPINIGDYCFLSTKCTVLGGSQLPAYSVLGANSLLNKSFINEYTLYGGSPASPIKTIEKTAKYFTRTKGFVV